MQEVIDRLYEFAAFYGLSIIGAVLILVIGFIAAKWMTRIFTRTLRKTKVDETLVGFSAQIVHFALLIFVIIAALNKLGLQTTSLIAALGAAGLAIGLALQSHLSNLAAGFLILIFHPYRVGDFIDASGTMGTVEEITMLSTWLKSPDGKAVIVPNTKIYSDRIINFTLNPIRRIDLVIGIGYEDDIPKAKQIIKDIIQADERILADPAPRVDVSELADSSVNFAVRPWVKKEDWWDVNCDLTEKIKLTFDREGISIPFPQRDVHIIQPETEEKEAA